MDVPISPPPTHVGTANAALANRFFREWEASRYPLSQHGMSRLTLGKDVPYTVLRQVTQPGYDDTHVLAMVPFGDTGHLKNIDAAEVDRLVSNTGADIVIGPAMATWRREAIGGRTGVHIMVVRGNVQAIQTALRHILGRDMVVDVSAWVQEARRLYPPRGARSTLASSITAAATAAKTARVSLTGCNNMTREHYKCVSMQRVQRAPVQAPVQAAAGAPVQAAAGAPVQAAAGAPVQAAVQAAAGAPVQGLDHRHNHRLHSQCQQHQQQHHQQQHHQQQHQQQQQQQRRWLLVGGVYNNAVLYIITATVHLVTFNSMYVCVCGEILTTSSVWQRALLGRSDITTAGVPSVKRALRSRVVAQGVEGDSARFCGNSAELSPWVPHGPAAQGRRVH